MTFKILLSLSFCLSLSVLVTGCATTSSANKDDVTSNRLKRSAEFIQNIDGSAYSPRGGIYCPAILEGLSLQSAKNYIADGSDLGCDYGGDGRKFSMFLSYIPSLNLEQYFDGSVASLKQVFEPRGYKYSEEFSSVCESVSIDTETVMSSLLSAKNNTATISTWPAAVFVAPGEMSIIGIDEVASHEFMKIRYTLPASSKEEATSACTIAYSQLKSFRRKMNEDRGVVKSEDAKLKGLVESLTEKK